MHETAWLLKIDIKSDWQIDKLWKISQSTIFVGGYCCSSCEKVKNERLLCGSVWKSKSSGNVKPRFLYDRSWINRFIPIHVPIILWLYFQAHYRLIEALALERAEVETEPDSTLPPIDRQKRKLGDIPQLFNDAHGYQEITKKPAPAKQARKIPICFRCNQPGHYANMCQKY